MLIFVMYNGIGQDYVAQKRARFKWSSNILYLLLMISCFMGHSTKDSGLPTKIIVWKLVLSW